jgi:hypothetical protein
MIIGLDPSSTPSRGFGVWNLKKHKGNAWEDLPGQARPVLRARSQGFNPPTPLPQPTFIGDIPLLRGMAQGFKDSGQTNFGHGPASLADPVVVAAEEDLSRK